MKNKTLQFFFVFLAVSFQAIAQDDLMEILDKESSADKKAGMVSATFKGTRLINGHTIETRGKGVLDVIISHRFGRINSGVYEFFGLDDSNVRLGVDYGVTDRLNIGIGRNSFEKYYDGFLKYKILAQSHQKIPVTVTFFSSAAATTLKNPIASGEIQDEHRWSYTFQFLIAKKFGDKLSLQIAPTLVHRNLVATPDIDNNLFALGMGGRIKLTKRLSFNAEYFLRLNASDGTNTYDALAVGFDIETGGHVFQLHFTNAQSMIERSFISETTGNFFDSDVHYGFNISRVFQLGGKRK